MLLDLTDIAVIEAEDRSQKYLQFRELLDTKLRLMEPIAIMNEEIMRIPKVPEDY